MRLRENEERGRGKKKRADPPLDTLKEADLSTKSENDGQRAAAPAKSARTNQETTDQPRGGQRKKQEKNKEKARTPAFVTRQEDPQHTPRSPNHLKFEDKKQNVRTRRGKDRGSKRLARGQQLLISESCPKENL